jgi:hypothetical protein
MICFDETEHFIFLPCTHKLCAQCKELLEEKKCPVCNTPFEQEPIQPEPIVSLRRTRIVAIDTSSKCIVILLLSFMVFIFYHLLSRSEQRRLL